MLLRVLERGRGGGKIAEIAERDVKEEGAVERGRENRLARATKSSFDHAVKSFNMVDAFGLLSSSAVHDFVTEDGSICMPRIATNCNTAVVPRSTRDRGVAALAS